MRLTTLSKLFAILFILDAAAVGQTTWYVDVNATPPGNGTPASPYTSIVQALASPATHNGDTLLVAPGTYIGNVTVQNPGVFLRSTLGPASTVIRGTVLADGIFGGNRPAVVDGFTIESSNGVSLSGATLSHCIVRPPLGSPAGSRGVFYDDLSVIEACTITRYHEAFVMFLFASFGAQIGNTIVTEVDFVIAGSAIADFTNCCLPSGIPTGGMITNTHSIVGNPGFKDPANGDYHLLASSICIDTGSAAAGLDPDGSVADIGPLPADPLDLAADLVYCSSEINGDGCLGLVQSSGVCSATSGQPYILSAHGLPPNKLGRLLYSAAPANTPFQGGTLCLANPLHRTDPTYSGSNGLPPPLDACSGVLTFDFNARIQSGIDPGLVVGRHVYGQFRYRDPHDPLGFAVGWTDALRFVIAP